MPDFTLFNSDLIHIRWALKSDIERSEKMIKGAPEGMDLEDVKFVVDRKKELLNRIISHLEK